MRNFRERKTWIVLIAVLLLFAACKGESPTAPPPGSGIPPGGTQPPTGVTITLTTTSANPLADSTVTITANVTQNNAPVPDGTAVEFNSDAGVLGGNGTSVVRTTTGGIATVTLTSAQVRRIRVTATVNNVTQGINIEFVARPVEPQPPNTAPTITSVSPAIGNPAGGQIIRITGTNFFGPVKVLFDLGGAVPVEASVVSVTETAIEVVTPPINLGAGQERAVDVIVLTRAGASNEQRVEASGAFTFRNVRLTPVVSTVTPNSGPVTGGTRVTIIGEGFQEPVQVLFDTAEARVLDVDYDQILVETPSARDTSPDGTGPVTGPVTVSVRNILSNTSVAVGAGFLYKAAMQIITVSSGGASTSGGTRVTIDGNGFVPPVSVVVRTGEGDIALQPISVVGTRIIALTPEIIPQNCGADLEGPIVVTNQVNGDFATGPIFGFDILTPAIVNINPTVATEGTTAAIFITVANPIPGLTRFRIQDKTVFPTGATENTDGTVTFTVPLPTNFEFPTEACGDEGERDAPLTVDVTYLAGNAENCDDTAPQSLTILPEDDTCVTPPEADINVLTPVPPACLVITTADNVTPNSGTITIQNTGDTTLTLTGVATPNPQFSILPANASIPPGGSQNFTVTFTPGGTLTDVNGNVAFNSNDPDEPTVNVCLTGNVP